MLCQRSSRNFAALFTPSRVLQAARKPHPAFSIRRTFSSLPSRRPTLFSSPFGRSTMQNSPSATLPSTTQTSSLDLQPRISSHPALAGVQIRCGPRNTFSPSHFVRKRRHGFLSRQKTRKGRATLVRRRLKRRSTLSH